MSFNKAIEHNKEHRKQYTGAKAIDRTCRNHGSCLWCEDNRTYKNTKRIESFKNKEHEYLEEDENDVY